MGKYKISRKRDMYCFYLKYLNWENDEKTQLKHETNHRRATKFRKHTVGRKAINETLRKDGKKRLLILPSRCAVYLFGLCEIIALSILYRTKHAALLLLNIFVLIYVQNSVFFSCSTRTVNVTHLYLYPNIYQSKLHQTHMSLFWQTFTVIHRVV